MSKKILFSLVLFVAATLIIDNGRALNAEDLEVCPTCDYTTIQSAISDATSGVDRVVVGTPGRSGAETYAGIFFMKSGVDVVSEPPDEVPETTAIYDDPWSTYSPTVFKRATLTIISGGGASEPVVTFDETIGASTKLDGFTVENINPANPGNPLIVITGGGTYTQVKNCIIRNNQGSGESGGIGTRGWWSGSCPGSDCFDTAPTIDNNFIHHVNGPGIGNGPYSHATITNNEIWDCKGTDGPGIGLQGDTYPTIEDNLIFNNNRAGIGSDSDLYGLEAKGGTLTIPAMQGNEIHHNGAAGIALERASGDTGTFNVTIGVSGLGNENEIYQNRYAGIELNGIDDTTIENSDIYGNGTASADQYAGVFIKDSCSQVTIKDSLIHENSTSGIRQEADGGTLIVTESHIYSNGKAGISIVGDGSTTIIGNEIFSNGEAGIGVDAGSNDSAIVQNNIYSNNAGIVFGVFGSDSLNYDIIKNNIYQNVTYGGIAIAPGSSITPTLDIRQNRVFGQQSTSTGGGIQVVNASGAITIENNLVYENGRGGVRFGDSTTVVKNNTVVGNGSTDFGGGIVHSDNYPPELPTGDPPGTLEVKNNISTHNEKAGIRTCGCVRDYNLVYLNNGATDDCGWYVDGGVSYVTDLRCTNMQFGGCGASLPVPLAMDGPHEIIADPEFVNISSDDYHLDVGVPSPAIGAGEAGVDMGCYGGQYPMHNLIDVDTSTGNTPSGGAYMMFDLGDSYTVTDIRLFRGNSNVTTWNVYIGGSTVGCTGSLVGSGSLSVAGWNDIDVTDTLGRYIKLECTSHVNVPAGNITEFNYKKNEDSGLCLHAPSIVVGGCTDING